MSIVRKLGDKSNSDIKVNNLSTNNIFDQCDHRYKSSSYESYWSICQIVDVNGNLIDNQYKIWLIQPYKFTDVIKPFHERQIKKDVKKVIMD
jgi:hypothetical protein